MSRCTIGMKTNDQYFAADADHEPERERLGLFEQLLDPLTLQRLARIGVVSGWRCLLVGAGRGSLAARLVELVGPAGEVVATDRDVRFMQRAKLPGVRVREHDVLSDPLETAHYDLVHCRCLLMHLREPDLVLQKMTAAIRSGGWLLVEEPDDTAAGPVNSNHPNAERFAEANRRLLEQLKTNRMI